MGPGHYIVFLYYYNVYGYIDFYLIVRTHQTLVLAVHSKSKSGVTEFLLEYG